MCGIWAVIGCPSDAVIAACLKGLRSRGPDGAPASLRVGVTATLGFTRLAINGLTDAGMQPMTSDGVHIVCNGEIYNYEALAAEYGLKLPEGVSDCGVLAPLWAALDGDAEAFARALDGVFAFVLVDTKRGVVIVGRDPYGVRPLFQAAITKLSDEPRADTPSIIALHKRVEGFAGPPPDVRARVVEHCPATSVSSSSESPALLWSSELRGVLPATGSGDDYTVSPFPPGTVRTFSLSSGSLLRETAYHTVPWVKSVSYGYTASPPEANGDHGKEVSEAVGGKSASAAAIATAVKVATGTTASTPPALATRSKHVWPHTLTSSAVVARSALRESLIAAVEKRLLSDVPVGALLSGGLDSSLVASIAARLLKARGAPPLATFSIGMPGSSDLAHARLVANLIGSDHHEIVVSIEDFWAALPETLTAIESFDLTSVRASVGNYLVAKYVREKTNVRVLLNGDGADEASGSYLYFYGAPHAAAFEAEVARLLRDIHHFDVLRSDRCVAGWGLEARTPFLDKQFVATYLSMPTALRRPVRGGAAEKQLLREAFDDVNEPYLPAAVLWRRKEAFSDVSVGSVVLMSECVGVF
jgi:asparagine synthetase B (glutamine-hydrolysing)